MFSVHYLALLWLPYFFENLGGRDSVLLSISYPISYTFGTLLLAPIKSQNSHKLGLIFLVAMIGSTLLLFITWFLGDDPSEMISYMVLISLSVIFMSVFPLLQSQLTLETLQEIVVNL